ncbi:MAG: 2-amino-4-hydroxy-6-hydroxymethyldihydropteridine pyrophosphokinase [Gracilibacter sp. BRH_c7a]|nr:MAG: 2-amino-4-hydroxy-6-hydroxymethyldihydropteridine pyrophosphokinase [Gracilibacter sp. BRH_c7a]
MIAYLSLGTNEGNRYDNLEKSLNHLNRVPQIDIKKISSIYETEPWGGVEQQLFLNQVILIDTRLDPESLLQTCLEIESAMGRQRRVHWGPREIDIDILLYGDLAIQSDTLIIPHPYMEKREFVLAPLREIAPNMILPSGKPIISTKGEGEVKKILF